MRKLLLVSFTIGLYVNQVNIPIGFVNTVFLYSSILAVANVNEVLSD